MRKSMLWWLAPAASIIFLWEFSSPDLRTTDFLRSYWMVTYDHGFVRRGLGGTLARALFLGDVAAAAEVMPLVCGIAGVAAVVWVAVRLISRRTPSAASMALLILASPVGVSMAMEQRRPDLLALVIIPWLWASRRAWIAGAVLGALVLIHEGIVFSVAPWIITILILRRGRPLDYWAAIGPAAAATLVVMIAPRDVNLVALRMDAAKYIDLAQPNLLTHMGDSLPSSIALVASYGPAAHWSMLVLGTLLVAGHAACLWLARIPIHPNLRGVVALAFPTVALVAESAIGIDWVRWVSIWLLCALMVLGLAVGDGLGTGEAFSPVLALVVVGLVMLPVLPELTDDGKWLPYLWPASPAWWWAAP